MTFRDTIQQIHETAIQAALAVTGGGASAVSDLLAIPGGSATLLEAIVPYSTASLSQYLGREPEQACSAETALAMATTAFRRVLRLAANADGSAHPPVVGLGCTASLVSRIPKRGEHRCWVATHSLGETRLNGLILAKNARSRPQEERVISNLILATLAHACGIKQTPNIGLADNESVTTQSAAAPMMLRRLVAGQIAAVWRSPDGSLHTQPQTQPAGLLSGSFNPLHIGHRELRAVAEKRLGSPVWFELAIVNPDKPPLDYLTIERRCRQFDGMSIVLSSASTFVEKARLFPNTVFVVGADTAERIVDAKYYGGRLELTQAMQEIRDCGCRFLVAGRACEWRYIQLQDLPIPAPVSNLFEMLTESEFRRDISSTALRSRGRD